MKKKYKKEELGRLAFYNELKILYDFFAKTWMVLLKIIKICHVTRARKQVEYLRLIV
jgi:hypothetical protein